MTCIDFASLFSFLCLLLLLHVCLMFAKFILLTYVSIVTQCISVFVISHVPEVAEHMMTRLLHFLVYLLLGVE